MIRILKIDENQLNQIKNYNKVYYNSSENLYSFSKDGNVKFFKLFKSSENVETKLKKIDILNNRLKNTSNVAVTDSLLYYNGKIIGYTYSLPNCILFNFLSDKKNTKIQILKKVSEVLKQLHKLGIVASNIATSVIVDNSGNIHLLNYDKFSIDSLPCDINNNMFYNKYKISIPNIDRNFDNYLLNLITIATINNIYIPYIYNAYDAAPWDFNFRDKEINGIVESTFHLNNAYNERLIVDEIK